MQKVKEMLSSSKPALADHFLGLLQILTAALLDKDESHSTGQHATGAGATTTGSTTGAVGNNRDLLQNPSHNTNIGDAVGHKMGTMTDAPTMAKLVKLSEHYLDFDD